MPGVERYGIEPVPPEERTVGWRDLFAINFTFFLNPVMMGFLNASCDKAMFGWPCDKEIESLRDQFARETNPAKLKGLAEAVQVRVTHYPTHVHVGQWYQAAAVRKTVDGMLPAPVPVFWNVEKKGR